MKKTKLTMRFPLLFFAAGCSLFSSVYQPPIITGATTVNEGGTLFLSCDTTNSNREPLAQWFDKDGQMVSSSGVLNIPNIMRSQAGSYTCRTSPPNLDNSTSTTVTVVVQFLSQSVDDCTATVQIVGTTNQIDIPLGTVCVECVVNGEVVTDPTTTFLIGNSPITSLDGGVLVIDDTSMTFQASPALILRCSSSGDVRQASVFLDVYQPPIITGATTVNEGGTLFLSCDTTNSNREPLAQWFDKDGQMVSSSGVLNIPNIMRSQAGSYTCRTSPPNLDNSTSTSVTAVVQSLPQSVDDCTATVQIVGTTNQIDIPLGTVCVECVVNGEVVTDPTTTFLIGNSPITSLDGGVLVIDDTSMTFQASPALILRCSSSGDVRQASVFLDVYQPPIITGATTVNEGGTLFLSCDTTNSNREPLAQWFDKDGQMIEESIILHTALDSVYQYEPTELEGCEPDRNADYRTHIEAEIEALINEYFENSQ
ncbi:Hemicentin-2 [Geodia barretti]|uniref:Hemicentin-2 n=1 Tax=Geodia barretti TaxID=519541 RepID=A0AA35XAZ6_GEOBA|nr:Hemicentin-2 [Geodia barretti]